MAKSYRTPTVIALGAADAVTHGCDCRGPLLEPPGTNPPFSMTTHAMLDF
jgi:hypothetical protein